MVGINNGDAIFCIIMVLDSLARSNNSIVEIETLHTKLCPVLTSTEGGAGAEMIQSDSMPDIISTKSFLMSRQITRGLTIQIGFIRLSK